MKTLYQTALLVFAVGALSARSAELPYEPKAQDIEALEKDDLIIKERPRKLLNIGNWRTLFTIKDYLSIRMGIRDLLQHSDKLKKNMELWRDLRDLIARDPLVGQDLRALWDKLGPRNTPIQTILEKRIKDSDEFLARRDFVHANAVLLGITKSLLNAENTSKLRYKEITDFEYYLRVAMARSLYGSGDYKNSALMYASISPAYYDFGQVLFERQWANYRAGRADWALGDLTSLVSGYFGKIVDPESLLVGVYAAYELCQSDLAQQLRRMYMKNLKTLQSRAQFFDVHQGDPVLLTLRLAIDTSDYIEKFSSLYTKKEREEEKKRIAAYLINETERRRDWLRGKYERLLPYLASAPKVESALHKKMLPSRSEIFQGPFKPAKLIKDEVWADEVGYFLFRPKKDGGCSKGESAFEVDDSGTLIDAHLQDQVITRANFKEFQDLETSKRMFFFPRY